MYYSPIAKLMYNQNEKRSKGLKLKQWLVLWSDWLEQIVPVNATFSSYTSTRTRNHTTALIILNKVKYNL